MNQSGNVLKFDLFSMRPTRTFVSIFVAISAPVLLGGCLGLHVGGGKKTTTENKSETYNVTLGQQLMDLKKAYDSGAISKREYDGQRKKLLKDY
jgi:hypothetical protein